MKPISLFAQYLRFCHPPVWILLPLEDVIEQCRGEVWISSGFMNLNDFKQKGWTDLQATQEV